MKQRFSLIIILSLLTAITAVAQTITVEYMEGMVEVARKGGWELVNFGDTLALTDKVKVATNSQLELTYGNMRINITRAGTYPLQDLANSQKQVNSWQLGSLIDWKIKQLAGTEEGSMRSTTMGVRGANQSGDKNIEWMYMDDEGEGKADVLGQGEQLLQDAKYKEAILLFEELVKKGVSEEEESYLYYYLAYALASNAQPIPALKYIDKLTVKADHPLFTAVLLLKGRLLIDTLAFKDALDTFNVYLNTGATDDTAQSFLLLSSYCYKGLNNTSEQKKSLTKAEKLNPESAFGKEARRLLGELKS